jgi:hypothetical protein
MAQVPHRRAIRLAAVQLLRGANLHDDTCRKAATIGMVE